MLTREDDIDVHALRRQGWTITAIARHLGRDRKTIRTYLAGDRVAGVRARTVAGPFEVFAPYCAQRLGDDPHLWASTLFDELRDLGYVGSYPTMTRQIRTRGLRPACEDCRPATGRPIAVIDHPPGAETQWDWVELPDPPASWGWGANAAAAMANTAGGVIVLGVTEDDQARAQAAPGVAISDGEAARIRQVVAAGVSPLPQFDVFLVPDEAASGRGFVLIEVPRSVLAPHAVLVNVSLRFPKRNGSTTRYLSEPEVAAEYRARLAGAAERGSRIEQVEAEVLDQIDRHDAPWIVVSLLPDLPGDFVITKASFEAFEEALRSTTAVPLDGGGISFHDFGVSHERVRATDSMRINMPAWGLATELYTDGTGVLAQRLYSVADNARATAGRPYCPLSDEAIAAALVWSLQFLARHARDRAQTAGSATLRAVVLASSGTPLLALANDRRDLAARVAMPVVSSVPPVTTFATIDDLAEGSGLVASAARLHQAIGHALGVPELRQLTIDGQILGRGWGPTRRPHVEQWAAANGVEVLAVPVPVGA